MHWGSTLVRSAAWLVLPLAERGAFATGLTHGHAALDLAEAADDLYGIVSACYCLAYLHCLKGEVAVAARSLERALAIRWHSEEAASTSAGSASGTSPRHTSC